MRNYHAKDTGEFVNIGTGKDITIKELAEKIKNNVGFKGKINWDYTKPDGTPQEMLDVSKLENIGWNYKKVMNKGIKEIYDWYINY